MRRKVLQVELKRGGLSSLIVGRPYGKAKEAMCMVEHMRGTASTPKKKREPKIGNEWASS